jgi:ankyrin repeat protein
MEEAFAQKKAVDAAMTRARGNFGTLPDNFGPLHALASTQADPRVVAVELETKTPVEVDQQDSTGMTALMYAAKDLQGDIASHLVAAGASKALTNNERKTALALFDEALAADQAIAEETGESPTVDPNVAEDIRKTFEGGRRRRNRKTRARKPKRRTTRRRR